MRRGGRRSGEEGYTIVVLLVGIGISAVLMGAGVQGWDYLIKDSNEQELLFRGQQIADAIQRYQKKNGNAFPPSLEVLVKGKFLRKEFKDPMVRDGKWRFVRPGEGIGAPPPVGIPGVPNLPATPSTTLSSAGGRTPTIGGALGVIQGVVSTSKEKSLRVVNGRTRYNEWVFLPGQPMVVGRAPGPLSGGARPGSAPGTAPRTTPTTRP